MRTPYKPRYVHQRTFEVLAGEKVVMEAGYLGSGNLLDSFVETTVNVRGRSLAELAAKLGEEAA